MHKKWWLVLLVAVVVAGSSFWAWNHLRDNAAAPSNAISLAEETAVVKRSVLQVTVDGSGSIVPNREASLSFSTAGQVAEVFVVSGQHVKAGEPLAALDNTDLTWQVQQAKANEHAAQAQLDDLQNSPTPAQLAAAEASYQSALAQYNKLTASPSAESISIAKVQLEKAKVALAKAQSAYDKVAYRPDISALPQSFNLQNATWDYEKALAQYKQALEGPSPEELAAAKSNVTKAQAQLAEVKAGPSAAEIASRQAALTQAQIKLAQARQNLADATLVAPFAGTVVQVNIQPQDKVSANKTVVQLDDFDPLQVRIYLDETDVGQVSKDQEAIVTVDAFPDANFSGKVTLIDWVAQVQSGVVLYPVTIDLNPTSMPVRPGMTADAEIMITNKANALVVPLQAIHTFGDRSFVFRKVPAGETPSAFRGGASTGSRSRSPGETGNRQPRNNNSGAGRPFAGQAVGGPGSNPLFQQLRAAGFAPVPVTVGTITGTQVEILSGLKEGDVVSIASTTATTTAGRTDKTNNRGGLFGIFGSLGRRP